MVAGCVRSDNPKRGTGQNSKPYLVDSTPVGAGRRSGTVLSTLFLSGILIFSLTAICFAADLAGAAGQGQAGTPAVARAIGIHGQHGEIQGSHLWPLIEQVRFNHQPLSVEHGVTIGPEAGDLEIDFAAPPSGSLDRLRYRLVGFDAEWKDAGKERTALYRHLKPGSYEFDFQEAETGGLRGSVVECMPITVIGPYWKTAQFQTLSVVGLLVLIFVLYKLRVSYLVRRNRKLEAVVSQTKAELTLAAKAAGDAQVALKEQALKDVLTGLWNRRAIFAMLEREVCRAQRDHFPIALLMIDLDHFKSINDNYGHLSGDEVLRESANRLTEAMRPYDFAGRYGGEEFLVVLPSCSPQNALQRAEQFRRAIAEQPMLTGVGPLAVTCSVGVAAYEEAMPLEDLIHQADEALYSAKRMGRNCVCAGKQITVADRKRA
jgi:diguanylate cyclase (GGDEF)-like protein